MISSSPPSIQDALAEIDRKFLEAGQSDETDQQLADAALDWILERERTRYQATADPQKALVIDRLTLNKMRDWDTDDPLMLAIEKVFRRLAKGRGADAISLLKHSIQAKAHSESQIISREQQRRAETPRVENPLDILIKNFVLADPHITEKQLKRKLESCVGSGVVLDIDDDEITLCDERYKPVKISGLKNRLSRIKNNISQ